MNEVEDPGRAAFLARRHFQALDGLRCVAIVAVIWHHAHGGSSGIPITRHGFLGVDLFFVISGFLITTLILREQARTGKVSLSRFYVRRTLRIFPPYYALLLGLALFLLFIRPDATMRAAFFRELPYCLTYTSNWVEPTTLLAITWSLAAEEQFYLVWPPVERFLARHALKVLAVLLVLNQLVNFQIADPFLQWAFGVKHDGLRILEVTFTPILLGVLLAHLLDDGFLFRRARWLLAPASTIAAAALILVVASRPSDMSGWPRALLHVLMTVLVAGCVVNEGNPLARVLAWKPFQRIGAVSYGMYLLHLLALDVVMRVEQRVGFAVAGVRFAACLGISYVAAYVMNRWFERPILALKERFTA